MGTILASIRTLMQTQPTPCPHANKLGGKIGVRDRYKRMLAPEMGRCLQEGCHNDNGMKQYWQENNLGDKVGHP